MVEWSIGFEKIGSDVLQLGFFNQSRESDL